MSNKDDRNAAELPAEQPTKEQRIAAARAASATALKAVAQTVKILTAELSDLAECERDLQVAGAMPMRYPMVLAQIVAAQLREWEGTAEGREALGLGPGKTWAEQVLETAKADVRTLEENLEAAKAIVPLSEEMVSGRRRRIEDAAAALVNARRRVAELDPGGAAQFKAWVTRFGAEIRQLLANRPAIPRPTGDTVARLDARDAAEADMLDPLGATIRRALEE